MSTLSTNPYRSRGLLRFTLLVCCLVSVPAVCAQDSLHGGIEIGGKGVKATVIRVTPDKEGLHTQMIFASTANTALSGLEDGKFRPAAVVQTAAAVARFFKRMQDEYKVPAGNIYVVVSSGVPRPANFPALVKAIKEQTGKDLRSITDEEEVVLSFLGAVKPELRGKSMLVDIGGGNTKGGYLDSKPGEATGRAVYFSVPLGTVTYTNRVKKEGGNFAEAAARLRPSELVKPIAATAAKHPGLLKRQRIYLSGGTVWALVTLLKPEAVNASYVALSAEDIERFHKLATKDPSAFPSINLDGIKDPKLRERAAKEIERVRRTYAPPNLVAGSEILRALSEALELKGKQVIFPRYGFIAWIQSYVKGQTAPRR